MKRVFRHRRINVVYFTPYRALKLFLYSWVCASIGLGVFCALARQSFDQCAATAAAKLAQSLQISTRMFRGFVPPDEERHEIDPRSVPMNLAAYKHVGPPDLAVRDKPELERVHGQKRRAGMDVYEVRFVDAATAAKTSPK